MTEQLKTLSVKSGLSSLLTNSNRRKYRGTTTLERGNTMTEKDPLDLGYMAKDIEAEQKASRGPGPDDRDDDEDTYGDPHPGNKPWGNL